MCENAYLSIKNPKASKALKRALDPGRRLLALLARLRFAMSATFGLRSWAPPWPNPGSAPEFNSFTTMFLTGLILIALEKWNDLWSSLRNFTKLGRTSTVNLLSVDLALTQSHWTDMFHSQALWTFLLQHRIWLTNVYHYLKDLNILGTRFFFLVGRKLHLTNSLPFFSVFVLGMIWVMLS